MESLNSLIKNLSMYSNRILRTILLIFERKTLGAGKLYIGSFFEENGKGKEKSHVIYGADKQPRGRKGTCRESIKTVTALGKKHN